MKKFILILTIIIIFSLTGCKTGSNDNLMILNAEAFGNMVELAIDYDITTERIVEIKFKAMDPQDNAQTETFEIELNPRMDRDYFSFELNNNAYYEITVKGEDVKVNTHEERLFIHTWGNLGNFSHEMYESFLDNIVVPTYDYENYTMIKEYDISWKGANPLSHQETIILKSNQDIKHLFTIVDPNDHDIYDMEQYEVNDGIGVEYYFKFGDNDWSYNSYTYPQIYDMFQFTNLNFDIEHIGDITIHQESQDVQTYTVNFSYTENELIFAPLIDYYNEQIDQRNGTESFEVVFTLENEILTKIEIDLSNIASLMLSYGFIPRDSYAKLTFTFKDLNETEQLILPYKAVQSKSNN